jgi:hypothetical protein
MGAHGTVGAVVQSYVLLAITIGLVVGVATGGRLSNMAQQTLRFWPLLPLGVLLQLLVEADGVPAPFAVLLLSYLYLVVFAAANLHLRGMGVVLIGIALNALVIAANHGMPVKESAVRAAHLVSSDRVVRIDEVKHHLADDDTKLLALGDIVPVRPLTQVLSFGDLILCVGIADLIVHLTRPVRSRSRRAGARADANALPTVHDDPLEDEPEVYAVARKNAGIDRVIDLAGVERDLRSPVG